AQVREPRNVCGGGGSAAEDVVYLCLDTRSDARVPGQARPRPGPQEGGRLVTREEDRHHVRSQLAAGHGRACLCAACAQEEPEQVMLLDAAAATLLDDAVDDPVERGSVLLASAILECRPALGEVEDRRDTLRRPAQERREG